MFLELHMIQNFAPSNLNRDDTNNPKDCEFGGVRRARISSQCIKRAVRQCPTFAETTGVESSMRTRWMARKLKAVLLEAEKSAEEVDAVVNAFTKAYAVKVDKKPEGRTTVLLYLGIDEIQHITNTLLEDWAASVKESTEEKPFDAMVKALVKETKNRTGAPDIALFGRMLADNPTLNLDAACQVAHAISTHAVTMEMDFFTAVDDLQPTDETGAGMMGFIGFNSACFYRYARIDWDQLVKNLDGDIVLARRTIEAFLRASAQAIPTGKQNSFAAQNPPSFMLGVVRTNGMSGSLTNAFEKPVRARRNTGLVSPSVKALDTYWGQLSKIYGIDNIVGTAALAVDSTIELENLKDTIADDFAGWMHTLLSALPQEVV